MTGYGADEWWRVGPQLHRLRLLTAVDTAAFSAYCMACGRWREAEEIIARVAAGDHAMHGLLVKTTDGNARRNPLIKIAADAAADMVRYASEFGLSPVARSRLAAGVHGQPSFGKFDGLIGGA